MCWMHDASKQHLFCSACRVLHVMRNPVLEGACPPMHMPLCTLQENIFPAPATPVPSSALSIKRHV